MKVGSLVRRKLDQAIYIVTKMYRNEYGGWRVDIQSSVYRLLSVRPSALKVLSE
jgi:hypothetical protein